MAPGVGATHAAHTSAATVLTKALRMECSSGPGWLGGRAAGDTVPGVRLGWSLLSLRPSVYSRRRSEFSRSLPDAPRGAGQHRATAGRTPELGGGARPAAGGAGWAGPRPDPGVERRLLGGRLRAALNELPERYRAALVLFDVEGYSQAEIAQILRMAPGTVRSAVFHARRRLRRLMADWKEAP